MKPMKKLQVAIAVASLFAVTGSAMAASISQSGLTVAREVIAANTTITQSLKGPAASYNFDNGPTANAQSSQDFNITLKLGGDGAPNWGGNVPTYKTVAAVRRNSGDLVVPVVDASYPLASGSFIYIRLMGVDDIDATTKRFRFRLQNETNASVSLGDLQISFNSVNPGNGGLAPYVLPTNAGAFAVTGGAGTPLTVAPVTAEYASVVQLATAANASAVATGTSAGQTGSVVEGCGEGLRRITLLARNYIGSGAGVEGESAGASPTAITNNGYIVFGTALNVAMNKGVAKDRSTDPTAGNSLFSPLVGAANDTMVLGRVIFSNVAGFDAWDTDTTGNYYKLATSTGRTNEFNVPVATSGEVDVQNAASGALKLDITSSNGFSTGTKFALSNTPNCSASAGPIVTTLFGAPVIAGSVATASFTLAQLQALVATAPNDSLIAPTIGTYTNFGAQPVSGNNGVYLCMQVGGANIIPQSSFSAVATLLKNDGTEQANFSCPAPLAGLGGGVKVDVRNFISYDAAAPTEWVSVIRVINNSEVVPADLTGQYIRADGKYGKWGSLGTIPPRGARYFSNKEIFDALTNASTSLAAAITDNTGAGGIAAPTGQATPPNSRLRISSNAASTLRVQNYFYNNRTGQLAEASGAQGADFVNIEASPRDHIDQDAQTGIKK